MITVSYKDTNGVRELVCSGHAGYGGKAGKSGATGKDNPSVAYGDSSPCTGEPDGAAREEGDPSGEALGMTPHPSPPSAAPPVSPAARSGRGSDSPLGCHSLPRPPLRYPQGEGAGGDIVCAAASAITGSLAATLLKHDEEFFSLFISEGDGECRVTCAGAAAKPYFEFALVGLKKLAEAFPENVRVAEFCESEVFR